MLETTTEPLTLDVYRGNSMLPDADPSAWSIDFQAGHHDAMVICRQQGEIPQLIHSRAMLEDIRDIDTIEGWCSIDPDKVQLVELISLSPEAYMRLADRLTELVDRSEVINEELQALEDEVNELRREEAQDDEGD